MAKNNGHHQQNNELITAVNLEKSKHRVDFRDTNGHADYQSQAQVNFKSITKFNRYLENWKNLKIPSISHLRPKYYF